MKFGGPEISITLSISCPAETAHGPAIDICFTDDLSPFWPCQADWTINKEGVAILRPIRMPYPVEPAARFGDSGMLKSFLKASLSSGA
nr:hypothetical protein [Sphingomonas bacterium]